MHIRGCVLKALLITTLVFCNHGNQCDAQETGGSEIDTGITRDSACGVSMGCMHDCSVDGTSCTYFASWMDAGGETIQITLKRYTNASVWTAIAFGRSPLMNDASVASCDIKASGVVVQSSYNPVGPNTNSGLQDAQFGVTMISGSHTDLVLSCTFTRAKTAALAGPSTAANDTNFFDLNKDWYIQLAVGPMIAGIVRLKHTEVPVVSPNRVDLQTFTVIAPIETVPGLLKKDEGCGSMKGCFHDCDESGQCNFINTWVDNGGGDIEYTMRFKSGGQNMYNALGLSRDDKMGDDSVIECVVNGNDVEVYLSYNLDGALSNSRLTQPKLGITWIRGSHQDGILECVFSRKKTFLLASNTKKRAATDASTYFDLDTDWYLLHAHGSAAGGVIFEHSDLPVVSGVVADFQSTQDLGAVATNNLVIKAHGIMMVLAWCLSASVGIILARFYKPVWGDSSLCGQKVWFQLHRTLMVLLLLLVTASFVLIFVDVGGYSQMSDTAVERAHPIMGIVVMVLTVVNPIMAMFRPGPNTPHRPVFNIAHLFVGTLGYVIATINVFFGVVLKLSNVSEVALYVLYAWLGWQVLIEVVLRLFDYRTREKSDRKVEISTINGSEPARKVKPVLVKKILIMFHLATTVGLSVGVSVIIGQS